MALDTATKNVSYISVDRLIRHPTLDYDYVSIDEYVNNPGAHFGGKLTPRMVAGFLEEDCLKALELVQNINIKDDKALLYEVADIKAWAYIGLHFAEKVRGGVALATYRIRGDEHNKKDAIMHLEKALTYWDSVIAITRPLYKDMPLVHLSQQGGKETKENFYKTFHWEKLRPDVARDIEIAKEAKTSK